MEFGQEKPIDWIGEPEKEKKERVPLEESLSDSFRGSTQSTTTTKKEGEEVNLSERQVTKASQEYFSSEESSQLGKSQIDSDFVPIEQILAEPQHVGTILGGSFSDSTPFGHSTKKKEKKQKKKKENHQETIEEEEQEKGPSDEELFAQGLPQSFQRSLWASEDAISQEEREKRHKKVVSVSSILSWDKDERNKATQNALYLHNAEFNSKVALYKGDITHLQVDAIVNAANRSLLGGGGVDGAIHSAAGPQLLEECKLHHGCDTGFSKITRGYHLPSKYVIHTVGPMKQNPELLASCYRTVLDLTVKYGIRSLAFCGISTGIYGYPLKEATEIALKTVREWLNLNSSKVDLVVFCTFLDKEERCYENILPQYFPQEGSEFQKVEPVEEPVKTSHHRHQHKSEAKKEEEETKVETLKGELSKAVENIKETVNSATEKASEFAQETKEKVAQVASSSAQKVKQVSEEKAEVVREKVEELKIDAQRHPWETVGYVAAALVAIGLVGVAIYRKTHQ
eukprot:TRINITY_DN1075_c0_g2_i1.p1 TRINITY_DN1075_c0_g2~~TRINITY_DN1075_c0_g2_i1.p1  ORF type:complete len:512 (+),score=175.90 TRINITY_DN1075_c0_g2_i1:372-1907(+)